MSWEKKCDPEKLGALKGAQLESSRPKIERNARWILQRNRRRYRTRWIFRAAIIALVTVLVVVIKDCMGQAAFCRSPHYQ